MYIYFFYKSSLPVHGLWLVFPLTEQYLLKSKICSFGEDQSITIFFVCMVYAFCDFSRNLGLTQGKNNFLLCLFYNLYSSNFYI